MCNNFTPTFPWQILDGTLEEKYDDFSDLITNFTLHRGKDKHGSKGQVVGLLKGALKILRTNADDDCTKPKILVDLPSAKPVKVLVRVYIIRVSEEELRVSLTM